MRFFVEGVCVIGSYDPASRSKQVDGEREFIFKDAGTPASQVGTSSS